MSLKKMLELSEKPKIAVNLLNVPLANNSVDELLQFTTLDGKFVMKGMYVR